MNNSADDNYSDRGEPAGVSPRTRRVHALVRGLTPRGSPATCVNIAIIVLLLGAQSGYAQALSAERPTFGVGRRVDEVRPPHDDAQLRELGIHRYPSQRLTLYSDIDPAIAKTLPPIIDAVYPAWVDYFGPLPPAEDGSEFHLTGYIMRDRGLFLDSGLLPEELVDFRHGKHLGYRFWMAEQDYDYYRRHLLIHEATHCFMTCTAERSRPPLFYQEGMAELFGAHEIADDGKCTFRTMPTSPLQQVGFGRIEMIQQEVAAGRALSLEQVIGLSADDFTSRSIPYAWSWAVCKFLDSHPRSRDKFRQLAPLRDGDEFRNRLAELFAADRGWLRQDWDLFCREIEYGYDIPRQAIQRPEQVTPWPTDEPVVLDVLAESGWQGTGLLVSQNQTLQIAASGEVTLGDAPKPWVSQPQGVTIRYHRGVPLGRLQALVLGDPDQDPGSDHDIGPVMDIGRDATVHIEQPGQLFLRVNDFADSRFDKRGSYRVTVTSPR